MDPGTALLLGLINSLPGHWPTYTLLVILAVFGGCKLTTIFVPPPQLDSKWVPVYGVVNKLALNMGWAVNAYQVGRTAAMTPTPLVGEARTLISQQLPVAREDTKP